MLVACRSVQYVTHCTCMFVIFLSVVDALQWASFLFSESGHSECGDLREICRACLLLWLWSDVPCLHSPGWNNSWMELEWLLFSLIWCSFLHLNVHLELLLKVKTGLFLFRGPLPLAKCADLRPVRHLPHRHGRKMGLILGCPFLKEIWYGVLMPQKYWPTQFLWVSPQLPTLAEVII